MKLEKMQGAFGAIVDGIDLRRPLTEVETRQLVEGLYENHILVVRGQEGLESSDYLRFGQLWGEPIKFFRPDHRNQAFPELIIIHNSPDTPEPQRDGAMQWHADSSYELVPASVTMLLAIEAPRVGNETLFVDMAAAWDALPTDMKARIEHLQVLHQVSGGRNEKTFLPGEKRGRNASPHTWRDVIQPLVLAHPATGRKALYAISGSSFGIVGMDEDKAIQLLIELKKHATQPQFVQRARAEPGSIVIWDNFAVMHSATPTEYSNEDGKRRLLHRISTRGLPPVCGKPFEWPGRLAA